MARTQGGIPGLVVKGRIGGLVYVPDGRGGMLVRRLGKRRAAPSVAQAAGAARFSPVAGAWNSLSISEAKAWRRFGEGLGAKPDGRAVQANNAFTALGTKILQMRPGAELPRLPPTEAFLGDGIRVGVSASGSPAPEGLFGRGGRGERQEASGPLPQSPLPAEDPVKGTDRGVSGPLPQPPLQEKARGEGACLWVTASGPNAEGVVTELLTQRLKSRLRTPVGDRYRSAGFTAFAAGALTASIPCKRGAVAVGVRFVREDTGQETGVVELGVLEVG